MVEETSIVEGESVVVEVVRPGSEGPTQPLRSTAINAIATRMMHHTGSMGSHSLLRLMQMTITYVSEPP